MPHQFEFYFPKLDTFVQVEESANAVVIRTTRDSFSNRRKAFFIHELAAEGFISDNYHWASEYSPVEFSTVHWIIDYSWLKPDKMAMARTRRFMVRLILSAALLWIILMVAAFVS